MVMVGSISPVSLFACTKDRQIMDGLSFLKKHSGRKRSAESRYFFGIDEPGRVSEPVQ